MTTLLKTLALSSALALGAGAALAESHADPAVSAAIGARQAHMQLLAFNLGALGQMAQGKMDYNAEAAQAAADNLVTMSMLNQSALWPMGSDSESVSESRALPVIWTDFAGVGAAGAAFAEAAAGMQAVAGDGLDAVRGAMGPLGASCGGCHQSYRQPK